MQLRINRKRQQRKKLIGKIIISLFLIIIFYILLIIYLSYSTKTVVINPLAVKTTGEYDKINNLLLSRNIPVLKVEQEKDLSYKLNLKDNGIVYISGKKEFGSQIDSLQLILNRLTIEGKRFKTLDFRFDKPVISY